MKPHLPFYCGLVVALIILVLSVNPPATTVGQSVLIAQHSVHTIEACIGAMEGEIETGYDSSDERKRVSQELVRLETALGKLRIQADRRVNLYPKYFIAAVGALMLGGLLSQALVIRGLKRGCLKAP